MGEGFEGLESGVRHRRAASGLVRALRGRESGVRHRREASGLVRGLESGVRHRREASGLSQVIDVKHQKSGVTSRRQTRGRASGGRFRLWPCAACAGCTRAAASGGSRGSRSCSQGGTPPAPDHGAAGEGDARAP
eukprot:scaffold16030_cov118-Isochrysis_galbana.AAC.1